MRNPPSSPDDEWFAPQHCNTCKDAKRALFAYEYSNKSESDIKVVVNIQYVTHRVLANGRKTELARSDPKRVITTLPKNLERYIAYDGCVVLPDYFKTRTMKMIQVDGAPKEFENVTAIMTNMCLDDGLGT